jgi:hypothetical protein
LTPPSLGKSIAWPLIGVGTLRRSTGVDIIFIDEITFIDEEAGLSPSLPGFSIQTLMPLR